MHEALRMNKLYFLNMSFLGFLNPSFTDPSGAETGTLTFLNMYPLVLLTFSQRFSWIETSILQCSSTVRREPLNY